jgi:tetratricopeptide (TPR) repeat protein
MTKQAIIYACITVMLLTAAKYAQTSLNKNNGQDLPAVIIGKKISNNLDAGNWDEALDDLVVLYEEKDGDPNLRFYIALCYKELGVNSFHGKRYSDAIEFFEAALIYVDDDPDIYLSLGVTYFSKSNYEAAESAFEKVLSLDSNSYSGYKQLGQIYYLKDDIEGASKAWTRAVELNPMDQSLQKRLSTLNKQIKVSETFESDTNHLFSVYFDGEAMPDMKHTVLEILESAYYDIGAQLKAYPKRQVAVTLLTRDAYFDITGSPYWTAGLYEGQIKIPVANADYNSLKCVLAHEYVHAVIFDLMGPQCPWWLNEGLAQFYSEHDSQRDRKTGLALKYVHNERDEILAHLPGCLGTQREGVAGAYAVAFSAVTYFIDTYGEAMLRRVLNQMATGKNFSNALNEAYGINFMQFEEDWRRTIVLSGGQS